MMVINRSICAEKRKRRLGMKTTRSIILTALLALMVALAGCSTGKTPKASLQEAMLNTMDASSYRLSMTMQVEELELPQSGAAGLTPISMAGILKDAIINIDAQHDKQKSRTDMNLELVLPGMMEMKLTFPLIMTKDILYMKLPSIPIIQIPQEVTSKYIAMDLKELAEKQGQGEINIEAQQKLGQQISAVVLKHFDDKAYFRQLKLEDANLPADIKPDRVIKFAVTEEQYPQTVETLVNNVLPELVDILLANSALLETLQVEKTKLEQAKDELQNNKTELLNVLQNEVKLTALELTGAIQDDYLVHQQGRIAVDATNSDIGHHIKLDVSFTGTYSDIGKAVEFQNELPTDTITIEEVMSSIKLPFGL
jgi:hypothetical protein